MIDWSARAAAVFRPIHRQGPPKLTEPTYEVVEEVVSSVLAVELKEVIRKIDPSSTPADRAQGFGECASIMWFDGNASRRGAEAQAEKLMGILAHREAWSPSDLEDGREAINRNPEAAFAVFQEMLPRLFEDKDYRVICLDCAHNRHGRCTRHHQAGLSSAVIGPELAMLPQHCTAYQHIASSGEKQ